jgi:anti-sigma B factor antagonist
VAARASRIEVDSAAGSLATVSLEGEHDLSTAASVRAELEAALEGGASLVVDLGPATFIDSSILAALIAAGGQARELGLGFSVVVPAGAAAGVRRVIEVTGLADALTVRETIEAAIESARAEAAA